MEEQTSEADRRGRQGRSVSLRPGSDSGIERFRVKWCITMHKSVTWPHHGSYECRTCGRRYAVPWAQQGRVSVQRVGRPTLASSEL